MVWTFFSQSISQSLTSIIKNRQLIQKIYVPKLVFPIATVTSNLVNLFFFLIAYLGIALATPVGWSSTILLIIPVSLILFAMTAGPHSSWHHSMSSFETLRTSPRSS